MGDTLHKMEVKIEGDSSGLKKEMESSRQEVKRGVEAIQKETEKMKNPFRNLASSKTNDRGIAIVDIDPAFSETINSGIEYQVFLQKEEDGDIWIEEKDTEYFMVKGTPNLKFSWELKCIQKHYEHLRLDEKEVQEAAQKDNRDAKKDYDIIIDTVVEDYDKEMEELINESN